jgi:membrane associated rhomboid family serine protease
MLPITDNIKRKHIPYMTLALVLINTICFVVERTFGSADSVDSFVSAHAMIPKFLTDAFAAADPKLMGIALLNVFLSVFWHANFEHLFGNMCFFFAFGRSVEDRVGHKGLLTIYLLAGIAGYALQWFDTPLFPGLALGASGAIAGVLGAHLVFFPKAKMTLGTSIYLIQAPAALFLLTWFYEQASGLLSNVSAGVSFEAHVGGFVVGAISAALLTFTSFLAWLKDRRQRVRAGLPVGQPEEDVTAWVDR